MRGTGVSQKRNLAVVLGCIIAVMVAYGATYPRFHPQHPTDAAVLPSLPVQQTNSLSWERLTAAQQLALMPFATKWDKFSDVRKRKWLKIAAHYPKMSATAQKRLHARMVEWIRMTPEQRRVARENYLVSKKLSAQTREKAWRTYQQLPREQKEELAAAAEKPRIIVNAPSSSVMSAPITASDPLISPPVNAAPVAPPETSVLSHGS